MHGKDMKKLVYNIIGIALLAVLFGSLASCDKVSPTGILIAGTGVDDRVEMSYNFYKRYIDDSIHYYSPAEEYSFLIGADSHLTTDKGRMAEMLQIALDNDDLFMAHLGDIADTKAEYYMNLQDVLKEGFENYLEKYFEYDSETVYVDALGKDLELYYWYDKRYDHGYKKWLETGDPVLYDNMYVDLDYLTYPFFPVVGNHDITHNGWALFTSIFRSSFYEFDVSVKGTDQVDHFIFLDSANGTLGKNQIKYIEEGMMNSDKNVRHTFVFTHTNIFRPSSDQFSSTYPREELYYLLNKFDEWNCTMVFLGHVHKWDDRTIGKVRYVTLDSMGERNSPDPGDYLVRVTCKKDGTVKMERVPMKYVAK